MSGVTNHTLGLYQREREREREEERVRERESQLYCHITMSLCPSTHSPVRSIPTLNAALDSLTEPFISARIFKNLYDLIGKMVQQAVGIGRRLLNPIVDV